MSGIKFTILLLVAALIAAVFAAPVSNSKPSTSAASSSSGSFSGRATWFTDSQGSCDVPFNTNDMIVAMNEAQMGALQGSGSKCGQTIQVSYKGKSVNVKVVDTCPSQFCSHGQIDLSQAAFKAVIGDLNIGTATVDWKFV